MATFTTLEEVKAYANGSLDFGEEDKKFELRPEQREAVDLAKNKFCTKTGRGVNEKWEPNAKYSQFLWNAKMRFGKTVCALQLAKEMGVKRTLIVTHRPVVEQSWLEDFKLVFKDCEDKYQFGTRVDDTSATKGGALYDLDRFVDRCEGHYVFFVSMQYLRLSALVNEKTELKQKKNEPTFWGDTTSENEKLKEDILKKNWDLVVIDEAHEGTRTALGKKVIDEFFKKETTKILHLSGTPFNLYEDFKDDEIYTWDYTQEQQAKNNWNPANGKNPYEELPQLQIFTYDITKNIKTVLDHDGIFTFQEFFRTWTGNPKADHADMPDGAKGRFVHEAEVISFLDLLCKKDSENNFPFSTDEYRKMFRHTLWVVSHVNEAKALEQLLNEHKVFKRFDIKNVAGNNPDDETYENALDKVISAIGEDAEKTSTITISCGRLTTGVTVKPWTAVFYMKGGDSAATYMQTIFRVQSPYTSRDGRMKTCCYVFDFMPDRTLKIVAETAKFSSMAKSKSAKKQGSEEDSTQEERDKKTLKDFIDLCPVISMEGGQMRPLNINTIYKQLENVFIDRLVRKGFDDPCLYNQAELNKISSELINHIGENGGQAPDEKRNEAKDTIDLSHMTEEQRKEWEENLRKKKADAAKAAQEKARRDEEFKKQWDRWTDEEREEWIKKEAERIALREKQKADREEFRKRITNIRGIALRIPLLMFGGADAGDTSEDITVDNFTRKIKDESWAEFMPKGISKEDFNKIKKCFNATRFEEAGKKYRSLTREADFLHVEDRMKMITEIHSYFRKPDKETVLTPWRVVNLHMSDTLGGYCFYDETFDEKTGVLESPRYVERGDITTEIFDSVDSKGEIQSKVLEINSKTGLYPLYITYSLYRRRLEDYVRTKCIDIESVSVQEEQVVWDDIIANNIFVICNTPMAVGITRRTLFGFREIEQKANIKAEKLVEKAINDQESLVKELKKWGFWKGTSSKDMIKFNAVVGNPPYMETSDTNNRQNPIYHHFYEIAEQLTDIYSLISPARFLFNAGLTPSAWNQKMLEDNHLKVEYFTQDSSTCFPNTDIKGGVAILLRNARVEYQPITKFLPDENLRGIASKFNTNIPKLSSIIYGGRSDLKFNRTFIQDYPQTINDRLTFIQIKRPSVTVLGPNEEYELKSSTFEAIPYVFENQVENQNDYYHLLGLINTKRVWKYVKRKYMTPRYPDNNNIEKYKVFIPKANGSGILGEQLSKSEIGKPGDSATSTFISIGAFDKEEEAINCATYLKTKFLRCLLGILKITQDNPPSTWSYIPLQDFSNESDIDWSKSIQEIDSQLYMKYDLGLFEREFIEANIKPME